MEFIAKRLHQIKKPETNSDNLIVIGTPSPLMKDEKIKYHQFKKNLELVQISEQNDMNKK